MSEQTSDQPQPIIDSVPGMAPSESEWSKPALHFSEHLGEAPEAIAKSIGKVGIEGDGVEMPRFEEPAQPFNHTRDPNIDKRRTIKVIRPDGSKA